jgi:superfamily I DNA/RNA helicase
VVAIADHLIRVNHPGLAGVRLRPKPGNAEGQIHSVQWQTIEEEAQGLADYVTELTANRGYSPKDILILTPRRLLGYAIRDQIAEAGIAVHSFYHEEALEDDHAQRAFALLSLLADNEDRVALRWWLGHDSPSARCEAYRKVRAHCEATGVSPWTALAALADGNLTLPHVAPLVSNFRELVTTLDGLRAHALPDLINAVIPDGVEGCAVLRGAALLALPECEDVEELFATVQSSVTQPEIPEDVDFVRIMSLQKSKGLTSKVAIVAGCIQGLIPFQDFDKPNAEQQAILAEQRRLFYVAVTRCTEVLVLSSARTLDRKLAYKLGARVGARRGAIVNSVSSQFFGELGPDAPDPETGLDWAAGGYGF